jgi:hypothetical protein
MSLVATASREVRNKNLILIALCGVFLGLFVWDGVYGWPKANDETIRAIWSDKTHQAKLLEYSAANPLENAQELFEHPQKWGDMTAEQQEAVARFIAAKSIPLPMHSRLDILAQQLIAGGLLLATGAAVWWFFRCQKRRGEADENGISPYPGEVIAWDAIRKVDNTKWKKSGKVFLIYVDSSGSEQEALLDEYHLDKLRPVLQMLEENARHAEFISPPGNDDDAKKNAGGQPHQDGAQPQELAAEADKNPGGDEAKPAA